MRHLPMYSERPRSPVDDGGSSPDRSCSRCPWSAGDGRACLPADGQPGGLLVVGDAPTKGATRPFASAAGAHVRKLVSRSWSGPVVYDYAVKCPPQYDSRGQVRADAAKRAVRECRAYLAGVVGEVRPTRVLALGSWAISGLLGRSVDLESVRRGHGWVLGDVPVFLLGSPAIALPNKFLRVRFDEDVTWALTTPAPRRDGLGGVVHVVDDAQDALAAARALELHDELLFDVETAGRPHHDDFTVLCAGLAVVDELEGDAWVWSARGLADPAALATLRGLLTTKRVSGSNVKYDLTAARLRLGLGETPLVESDTQLLRKLLDSRSMGRLEYCAELVGLGGSKEEADGLRDRAVAAIRRKQVRPGDPDRNHWAARAILEGGDREQYSFALLPEEALLRYNGRDVATSAAVATHLVARGEAEAPRELLIWRDVQRPALKAFERIERVGIAADRRAFEVFADYLRLQLDDLRERFQAYGEDFNPSSAPQVADVLFKRLKLPVDRRYVSEKTGDPSTAKGVLERLRGRHRFVDDMLEFRRLEKMDVQYATGLLRHVAPDGRIHATFRIDGTETLRVSCERPNNQNFPRADSVEGRMCRDCFTASPGNWLIELDQSQVELRVAAGMSGDPDMVALFRSGADFHMQTARSVAPIAWGIQDPNLVTEWHRQYCKSVIFGLLYGKTDAGLAAQLGCTVEVAARLRRAILGNYKLLDQLIKKLLHHVRTHGWVDIPWIGGGAHRRLLYEAGSPDQHARSNAENSSINSPTQGAAALLTIAAIPRVHEVIDRLGAECEVVNTVHDSIYLDCAPEWFDRMVEETVRVMEGFDCWGVPLRADVKAGFRSGSMLKLKRGEKLRDAKARWALEALRKDDSPVPGVP